MKAIREILLSRHQPAEAKLNTIRERVLRQHLEIGCPKNPAAALDAPRSRNDFVRRMWLELVWSCRRFWLGLGAVWVVILTFQILSIEPQTVVRSDAAPLSPALLAMLREQRRLAAELSELSSGSGAEEPLYVPRPRSERPRPSSTLA